MKMRGCYEIKILIIAFILSTNLLYGQLDIFKSYLDNKSIDDLRDGLWFDENNDTVCFGVYNKGAKNGVWLNLVGEELSHMEYYSNGKIISTFCLWDNKDTINSCFKGCYDDIKFIEAEDVKVDSLMLFDDKYYQKIVWGEKNFENSIYFKVLDKEKKKNYLLSFENKKLNLIMEVNTERADGILYYFSDSQTIKMCFEKGYCTDTTFVHDKSNKLKGYLLYYHGCFINAKRPSKFEKVVKLIVDNRVVYIFIPEEFIRLSEYGFFNAVFGVNVR